MTMDAVDSHAGTAGGPPSSENVIALEQSYLKVPLEQARRSFRNELKIVDKDISALVEASGDSGQLSEERRTRYVGRVRAVLDKLTMIHGESFLFVERLLHRMEEVSKVCNLDNLHHDMEKIESSRWHRLRASRLIAEYLLHLNLGESATLLASQQCQNDQVDFELYAENRRIVESLKSGIATECLAWCSENRTSLKKIKSPLEFILRRQEYIELIRVEELSSAIAYARKHFPPFMEGNEREIEQAFALLAIPADTATTPYSVLYDKSRWNDIAELYEQENRSILGLPERPQLASLLLAGLSTLKTHQCGKNKTGMFNVDCPVCSLPLSKITSRLPYSHHETSILVCPISGTIMDADNAPLALPNGHVYSQKALEKMAELHGGYVICPRTNEKFRFVEVRKCYIS